MASDADKELSTIFLIAEFLMFLALEAYRRVLSDSSKLVSAGETHATMTVLEFPKIYQAKIKAGKIGKQNST